MAGPYAARTEDGVRVIPLGQPFQLTQVGPAGVAQGLPWQPCIFPDHVVRPVNLETMQGLERVEDES